MAEKDGAGGQSEGSGDSIQIKVGDEVKTFTPQEIQNQLEKAGNLQRAMEGLSGYQKVLTQYGVNSDEYIQNSEAAFQIMNTLIERGLIDQQGNLVEKKKAGDDDPKDRQTPGFRFADDPRKDRQLETIGKALQTITSKIEQLEEGQSSIYRRNIKRDVMVQHPNLDSDDDISRLLATAQRDKSKSFWDHAAEMSREKETITKQTERGYVKSTIEALIKAGIIEEGKVDMAKLDTTDLNSLKEQSPLGGAPTYEGKKFLFKSRFRKLGIKDQDKYTSPADATKETFNRM